MVHHLLGVGQAAWHDDPASSESLAAVALEVVEQLEATGRFGRASLNDLRAEIWASIANARRLQGDFLAASKAFRKAATKIAIGTGDPGVEAKVLTLRVSVARSQNDVAAWSELLGRSLRAWREADDWEGEVKTRIQLGTFFAETGQAERGAGVLRRVCASCRRKGESKWLFYATENLASALVGADDLKAAEELLPETRELFRDEGGALNQSAIGWLEGRVLSGRDHGAQAIEKLLRARGEYARAAVPLEAASLGLEAAGLCLRRGWRRDAVRLAGESYTMFRLLGTRTSAWAALRLWQQAWGF